MFISGLKDRNRALNGDIVVVSIYPRSEWKVRFRIHVNPSPHTVFNSNQNSDDYYLFMVSGWVMVINSHGSGAFAFCSTGVTEFECCRNPSDVQRCLGLASITWRGDRWSWRHQLVITMHWFCRLIFSTAWMRTNHSFRLQLVLVALATYERPRDTLWFKKTRQLRRTITTTQFSRF